MVVSQNKGTPIQTPKYYSPYYGDPQKGTPNFGKPPYNACINNRLVPESVRSGPKFGVIGFTWNPKVCKMMSFMAIIRGLGLLFYILLGFKA